MKSWRFWVFLFVAVAAICAFTKVFSGFSSGAIAFVAEDESSATEWEDEEYTEFA
jgi:hypothetical protein